MLPFARVTAAKRCINVRIAVMKAVGIVMGAAVGRGIRRVRAVERVENIGSRGIFEDK